MVTNDDNLPADVTDRKQPPFFLYLGLFFLLLCINALLARFAVFSLNAAPGISSFYIVVALMVVFALWFGMWGAMAAYAGCFVGAGLLSGIPEDVDLIWSLADFWQVLIFACCVPVSLCGSCAYEQAGSCHRAALRGSSQ